MEMVFSIVGIGLVAAALAVLLRQTRPEYALFVSLAAGIYILLQICVTLLPVAEEVRRIAQSAAVPEGYTVILFKALGICFVTQIACDTCKDAGESAISAKLELGGKAAVLVLSLPLFSQLLSLVDSLLH